MCFYEKVFQKFEEMCNTKLSVQKKIREKRKNYTNYVHYSEFNLLFLEPKKNSFLFHPVGTFFKPILPTFKPMSFLSS